MDDAIAATLSASLALLGADDATPCVAGQTLARAPTREEKSPRDDGAPLPRLRVAPQETAGPAEELVTTATLGRGGMGVVHLARQRSLAREVAVKTPLDRDARASAALLREARIMGGLEHPNVVPVHALGLTDEGAPVLVMKRIEGVTWATLLGEPAHPSWGQLLAGHGDRLRANLEVLAQVAQALAFVHARGVLHRDIKPENVMLGPFGEVYLLDWGLALRLDERAQEPARIVGTPGYFPPEMARGKPPEHDERTDVYLLGATLYELLSGRMPHDAQTVLGALTSSLLGSSEPLPGTAPRALVRLVDASLSLERDARPPSAEAFRLEISRYLASREATALARAAERALDDAEGSIAREGLAAPAVARPLHEARFALQSARALGGSEEDLGPLLARGTRRLIERELALRSPGGARAYLDELAAPTEADRAPVEALERQLERERIAAEIAERAAQAASVVSLSPLAAPLVGVVVVISIAVSVARLRGLRADSPQSVLLQSFVVYVLGVALVWLLRGRLLRTAGARGVVAFFAVWYSYPVPLALLAIARGQHVFDWSTALLAGTLLAAAGSLEILPGLWPTVPLHALTALLVTRWPERFPLFFNAMLVLNGVIIVRALRQRVARARTPVP